MFLQVLLC